MEELAYDLLHDVQDRHWWYRARRRILKEVLESIASRVPAGTWYDLGCGVGANLPVMKPFGTIVGIDSSPRAVEYCRQRGFAEATVADLNSLDGVPSDSGAVVLLADVIEHLEDESLCLAGARRILKSGGRVVITVPAYMFLWSPGDEIVHHYRRYTESQLRTVVSRHFEIERTTYFNAVLLAPIIAGRIVERFLKRSGEDGARVPPGIINETLRWIFEREAPLINRAHLPFGASILCVARKP